MWFLLLAVVFPPSLLVMVPMSFLPGGRDGTPFLALFFSGSLITFFVFFMACVHFLKALIATYLLEDRWNPDSPMWKVVMLAQLPDVMVALGLAVVVALSLL